MRILIAVFGVLSILLFTFHWMFKIMHWPLASELKFGAFGMAIIGLLLLGIDQFILKKKREDNAGSED